MKKRFDGLTYIYNTSTNPVEGGFRNEKKYQNIFHVLTYYTNQDLYLKGKMVIKNTISYIVRNWVAYVATRIVT